MSSVERTRYIPPPTTFILGRNATQRQASDATSAHWHALRDAVRKSHGFSVPDIKSFSDERQSSEGMDRRYSKPARKGGVTRDSLNRELPNRDRKVISSGQAEEPMTISQQPRHFSTPEQIYDSIDEDIVNNRAPHVNGKPSNRDRLGPSKESPPSYNDDRDEVVSRRVGRTASVYDPEDVLKRAELIERLESEQNGDVIKRYEDDSSDKLAKPNIGQNGARDYGNARNYGNADDKESSEAATLQSQELDSSDESISEDSQSVDDDQSLMSNSDESEKTKNSKKSKGVRSFLQRCAPSFAKKILETVEKKKNECSLCLDELAAKYKQKQIEKGEPVFTSYSCENMCQDDLSLKASVKKRVSNLMGGFYSKGCAGIQMLADILHDEKAPEKDDTWTGVEGEHGVRCIPICCNTIEDHTVYICSCCFNEECDRDVFVNTRYLDELFGCCGPVFVARSFENRPAHCEKMLQRLGEKRRTAFLKMLGRKCDMKGGIHCNSRVKIKDEEKEEKDTEASKDSLSTTE